MTRADTIYPLDKGIERELAKAESDPFNKESIVRYYKVRSCDMTKASLLLYLTRINQMSRLLGKKFEDSTIQDLEDLAFNITSLPMADSTKNRMRKVLKGFYRWLKKYPRGQFPPEIAWLVTKKTALLTVKSDDLISFDECLAISEHATNHRDKALMQCLLDAGCRIGEILTVRVGEVKFNEHGAVLNSDGKTGVAPLILTWSTPTLAQWLNVHPFRHIPDAPLFPKLQLSEPKQLSYSAARSTFQKCVKRSGFKSKRVWFHLFKHVSCTWDSVRGMPQSYRNFKHHWSPGSEMNKVYEHLSDSVIPMIQRWGSGGLERDKPDMGRAGHVHDIKLSVSCKRCDYENSRDSKFCNRCGLILDEADLTQATIAKAKVDAFLENLSEDPEKLEKFLSLIP